MKAKWIALKQNTLIEDDSPNMKLVEFVVVENMNAVKSVQQLETLNVCLNLVQTITVQTITNRSEVNRADSEEY